MTQDIECSLDISKVVETHTDEQTIAATLKGRKTIVHNDNGFDHEDTVEVTVTLKFTMKQTAGLLGVSFPGNSKIFALRDRDESLSGYAVELHPAMQQKVM